jgi:hypothetical protein
MSLPAQALKMLENSSALVCFWQVLDSRKARTRPSIDQISSDENRKMVHQFAAFPVL